VSAAGLIRLKLNEFVLYIMPTSTFARSMSHRPLLSEPLLPPTIEDPDDVVPTPGSASDPGARRTKETKRGAWKLKMLHVQPEQPDEGSLAVEVGDDTDARPTNSSPPYAAGFGGWGLLGYDVIASAAQALPMTLMNLTQAYSFAQLVCADTPLEPALVAAMHLTGLVVVQARLTWSSAVPRYAIATSDVTIALLCHRLVLATYRSIGTATVAAAASARATALLSILLGSFSQGVLYWVTGYIHAAEIVLFLPYPVLAGLLATAGGMVTAAAVSVATGVAVTDFSSLHHAVSVGAPQVNEAKNTSSSLHNHARKYYPNLYYPFV